LAPIKLTKSMKTGKLPQILEKEKGGRGEMKMQAET